MNERSKEICARCGQDYSDENPRINDWGYGCTRCRGKRPELVKTLGQEDDAYLHSKADAG